MFVDNPACEALTPVSHLGQITLDIKNIPTKLATQFEDATKISCTSTSYKHTPMNMICMV